jgi:hypothetical protein
LRYLEQLQKKLRPLITKANSLLCKLCPDLRRLHPGADFVQVCVHEVAGTTVQQIRRHSCVVLRGLQRIQPIARIWAMSPALRSAEFIVAMAPAVPPHAVGVATGVTGWGVRISINVPPGNAPENGADKESV